MTTRSDHFIPEEDYQDSDIYEVDSEKLRHFNKKERQRLLRLRRRAAYLEARIERPDSERARGHRKGELSALKWAIDFIQNTEVVDD